MLTVTPGACSRIGSWNVEGICMTCLIKIEALKRIMLDFGISILAIQETHISGAPFWEVEGFLVICSGGLVGEREYAGVGFIIAPKIRNAVVDFTQFSNRLIALKELSAILSHMKNHKGADKNNIVFELVRYAGNKFHDKLLNMYNGVINTGVVPDDWYITIFTMLPTNGNLEEVSN